ncbi:hypothetical protein [Mesorhizobium sp.]|uniref:hypothetical protein n=1 Tax=Mesorhizobium sp. TaxID=1871066 RepID=UPI000FD27D24|nr:hypothetical protein [Mesorhizobium sp.]RUV98326.1 hypothetical protein EOA88_00365 [Mesorhizobium sp. M5C.F.Ca.IN.020.14.1.1]RWI99135.1 MAG: hypothetical protein EOR23_33865 [Mesorhizobium sp.]
MPLVTTLQGANFNDPTLPRRGADPLLTGGTIHMFDVGNVASYAAQSSPINTGLVDISPALRAGTVLNAGTFTFAGNGAVATGQSANRGFQWTNAAYDLDATQDGGHLLMCAWAKPDVATLAAGALDANVPVLYRIGDLAGARADTDTFLGIGMTPNAWSFLSGGISPSAHAFVPAQVAVTQIAFEAIYEAGAGTLKVNCYKNGAKFSERSATYVNWSAPASAAVVIGKPAAGTNFFPWNGSVYRGFIEDVRASRIDVAEWIARDYAVNNGRFT